MISAHSSERSFNQRDQELFARLSGDYNPMHTDAIAARRLMFGGLVVHALNTVTWSLDSLSKVLPSFGSLTQIRATFPAALLVGDRALLTWNVGNKVAEATVNVGDQTVAYLEIHFGPETESETVLDREIPIQPCLEIEPHDMPMASGSVDLEFSSTLANQVIPNLYDRLSSLQLAVLLATTRIVGMRCPGLHSIYSRLNLTFEEQSKSQRLDYSVTKWDPRSGLTSLELTAPGVAGNIGCFYRPTPVKQPSINEVLSTVEPEQFSEHSALVVGGSRGLGALTAKLIAAGGGDVMVSYATGGLDAEQLADEVRTSSAKGTISTCQLDVLEEVESLPSLTMPYTHIYYFATPRIRRGHSAEFDRALFREYLTYYVEGAGRVLDRVIPIAMENACFIWPSTIFVEDQPEEFPEYVAAKVRGEVWCAEMERALPGLNFIRPRLPRLETDQTRSLQPVQTEDNLTVMLALCAPDRRKSLT